MLLVLYPPWHLIHISVFKCFAEQLDKHTGDIRHLSKRLKWQLRVLRAVIETRTTSYRVRPF